MKINRFNLFRWIAILLAVLAAVLLVVQMIRFSRMRAGFAPGTTIAGIAVGGLDPQEAADRITTAYNLPIELVYNDQYIQIKPSQLGFKLDIPSMIAAADQQRVTFRFGRLSGTISGTGRSDGQTPLYEAMIEREQYSHLPPKRNSPPATIKSPTISVPIPGTINFQSGEPGKVLDIEKSLPMVKEAPQSPTESDSPTNHQMMFTPKVLHSKTWKSYDPDHRPFEF